jgi:hypothetical protein
MECVSDWFIWCLALVSSFWVVRNVAAKPPGQAKGSTIQTTIQSKFS